ncbi:MAG: hypothetical protein J6A79_08985 [Clostridia bacterium]|nr:hypothetical protein [Clostridia bacterium]
MTGVIDFSKYVYEPIDLCACYDPIFFPSEAQVKDWERLRMARNNPFRGTVERRIGNTWYLIETVCDGNEALADLARRLIFSKEEALCS